MTSRRPVTRDGIIADLRLIADKAEAKGDKVSAVKALKYAGHIERICPIDPKPPSIDTVIDVGEVAAALASRFNPEAVASIQATVADLRAYRLKLVVAERETATVH